MTRSTKPFDAHRLLITAIFSTLLIGLINLSPAAADPQERVCISGVYPHLAVFNSVFDGEKKISNGGAECGIGAVVPWAGKLWLITYSPHCPGGSTDRLWTIDDNLNLEVRPESIGGTPAGRMIHRESQQLMIGPYAIDKDGAVRAIPYSRMNGRHTAIARHLTDPVNQVYYFDMEGRIYEVNVNTLDVNLLFTKPVPGVHGKGAYTGQGRYIVANNGEGGGSRQLPEDMGVLAEWDGNEWRIVQRRQFCDVTGPGGIHGAPSDDAPIWSIGWDRRSVLLMLLDDGKWYTYRLPKASHTYDHRPGHYSEWPRIREVAPEKLLMDMHAIFWDFPKTFSRANSAGLRPLSTHHRYTADFCGWNGRVLIASDDTSLMGNPFPGQAQSNIWFGQFEEISTWGPRTGWGGPWINDAVQAGVPSDPMAIAGFPQRCVHLAVGEPMDKTSSTGFGTGIRRCSEKYELTELPGALSGLSRVTINRGSFNEPALGYAFDVNQDVIVYLAVDVRGDAHPGEGWEPTGMTTRWGAYVDAIYCKTFPKGTVEIPANNTEHKPGDFGCPHLSFIKPAAEDAGKLEITNLTKNIGAMVHAGSDKPLVATQEIELCDTVTFTLEVDAKGTGQWTEYKKLSVAGGGYLCHIFDEDFKTEWIRVTADKDCVATAMFHFSEPGHDPKDGEKLFAALADADNKTAVGGLLRPAAHNRSLQYLVRKTNGSGEVIESYCEMDLDLSPIAPAVSRADEVAKICAVSKDFEVDNSSVIMTHGGRRYRLPKGPAAYDKPFATGWPRGIREVESERYLMNIHGTFYEKPREAGLPKIKPIASHHRQITDFCSWRGLLVLSGTKHDAKPDGHYVAGDDAGLWLGAIDDLWKLGKPVGVGGPWKATSVLPDVPSDPYLINGYDKKTVRLSHDADDAIVFTIEIDCDHTGFRTYQAFVVPPGKTVTHEFPKGFAAHWVRVKSSAACVATATFVYE